MTLSAASARFGPDGPVLQAGAPLPVEALVLGKPVTEVAELLPRLFNLCRAAQGTAARLALGLPASADTDAEILRDHLLKLCITLPRAFGLAPLPLQVGAAGTSLPPVGGGIGWGGSALDLFGPDGLPDDPAHVTGPLAPLFNRIAATFAPGVATCPALPAPPPLGQGAFENSAAGRQADHPLLRQIEATQGRGPLWRMAGLMADLQAAATNRLPRPAVTDGIATVPAARGTYALRIAQAGGIVTGIDRRAPTDHLLAPGGALLHALASLPAALRHLAPQVIALHDPCIPVTVAEAQDA